MDSSTNLKHSIDSDPPCKNAPDPITASGSAGMGGWWFRDG